MIDAYFEIKGGGILHRILQERTPPLEITIKWPIYLGNGYAFSPDTSSETTESVFRNTASYDRKTIYTEISRGGKPT